MKRNNNANKRMGCKKQLEASDIFRIMMSVVVAIISVFCLLGCEDGNNDEVRESALFLFKSDSYSSSKTIYADEFEGEFIIDVLSSDAYRDDLAVELDDTTYPGSVLLLNIGGLIFNPSTSYIAIYSTLSSFSSGEEYEKVIDDVTYYYANVGIAELPFTTNATYLFIVESFA